MAANTPFAAAEILAMTPADIAFWGACLTAYYDQLDKR
jgi:hypothetical protein